MSIPFASDLAPRDLRDLVRAALSRPADPWFPGIAYPITGAAWQRLVRHGFVPANYGTNRWLEGNPAAERSELATLDLDDSRKCVIEVLPASTRNQYQDFGLVFSESGSTGAEVAAIQSALSVIASVPSLFTAVAAYLRSLHLLQAPGLDFDVSHSDPEVPFSIFVSVPPPDREGPLRLAESIIHECMHLQLTMIETILPLVGAGNAAAFSPWQQRARPFRGILHGVYVFSVIDACLQALDGSGSLAPDETAFVRKRRREIAHEVAQVDHFAIAEELTDDGGVLVGQLLRRFGLNRFPA